jgi:hypothetical protein
MAVEVAGALPRFGWKCVYLHIDGPQTSMGQRHREFDNSKTLEAAGPMAHSENAMLRNQPQLAWGRIRCPNHISR